MAWTGKKSGCGSCCGTVININGGGTAADTTALEKDIKDLKDKVDSIEVGETEGAYLYKGSVESYDKLPTDAKEGAVYNVETETEIDDIKYPAGTNFSYTGGIWEPMNAPLTSIIEAFNELSTLINNTIVPAINEKASKNDLDGLRGDTYTKNEVDTRLTRVYRYKGVGQTIKELAGRDDLVEGDVFNMTKEFVLNGKTYPEGTNVAYNGSGSFDPLGGIKSTDPVLTSDITVAGLDEPIGAGVENGDVFTKGTSIEEVLKKLLSKEIFIDPSAIRTNKTFNVTYRMPTISFSNTALYQEIGSTVTLNSIAKGTSSASQSYNVGTFTYGYADYANLIDKPTLINSTVYTKSVTPAVKEEKNNFEVTFTSGFGSHAKIEGDTIPATALAVNRGTNSLTVRATGNTYTAEPVESANFYIATNLGNFENEQGTLNIYHSDKQDATEATATNSTTKQVTGVYRIFYGYTAAVDDYTETFNKSEYTQADLADFSSALFSEEGTTEKTKTIQSMSSTSDKSSHVIILPKTGVYELRISHLENSLGMSLTPTDYYTEQIPISYRCGNTVSNYIIYILKSAVPVDTKNIKISK